MPEDRRPQDSGGFGPAIGIHQRIEDDDDQCDENDDLRSAALFEDDTRDDAQDCDYREGDDDHCTLTNLNPAPTKGTTPRSCRR